MNHYDEIDHDEIRAQQEALDDERRAEAEGTTMQFTLTIDCDNDAFRGDPAQEVARILRKTAQRLVTGADSGRLLDVNGNTVGTFTLR